jgi:hypothetical protein
MVEAARAYNYRTKNERLMLMSTLVLWILVFMYKANSHVSVPLFLAAACYVAFF